MSRDLENEVEELRRNLETCFQVARPSEKFRVNTILATVQLRVLAEQFKTSEDSKERRRLINEYEKEKEIIQKGIRKLCESARSRKTITAPCRTLP